MRSAGRGFTLIELMVVILIISILVAVAIPIIHRQVYASKWSEGKSMMGTISISIKAYCAGIGTVTPPQSLWLDDANSLGFAKGDLTGAFFDDNDFSFNVTGIDPLTYIITATKPGLFPPQYQLDDEGQWTLP